MSDPTPDTSPDTRLAVLASQMTAMAQTMARVENKVNEVVTLDRTIAGLQSDYRHQMQEIGTQWKKIDKNEANLDLTDRKVEKWINTTRGVFIAAALFTSLVQICVIGAVTWGFNNLSAERSRGDIQDYRLKQMEDAKRDTMMIERK